MLETPIPSHAASLIVEALEPGIRVLCSKFSKTLSWTLEDFRQEAFLKVLEPTEIRDLETVVAYFATVYRNHVLSLVRRVQTQARTHGKLKDAQEGVSRSYDDSKTLELAHCIKNQLDDSSRQIVLSLLKGKTHRTIMKELPEVKNNAAFYGALGKIRSAVRDFYVME